MAKASDNRPHCKARMNHTGARSSSPCANRAKTESGHCGVHDPAKYAARKQASDDRFARQWAHSRWRDKCREQERAIVNCAKSFVSGGDNHASLSALNLHTRALIDLEANEPPTD